MTNCDEIMTNCDEFMTRCDEFIERKFQALSDVDGPEPPGLEKV